MTDSLALLTDITANVLEWNQEFDPRAPVLAHQLRLESRPSSLRFVLGTNSADRAFPPLAVMEIRKAADLLYRGTDNAYVKDVAVRHGLILRESLRALGHAEDADRVQALIDKIQAHDAPKEN